MNSSSFPAYHFELLLSPLCAGIHLFLVPLHKWLHQQLGFNNLPSGKSCDLVHHPFQAAMRAIFIKLIQ